MRNFRTEKVCITHMEPRDIQGSTGIVHVMAKNIKLICFATNYERAFATQTLNKEISVYLILETFKESAISEKNNQKAIVFSEKPFPPFTCNLSGQIIEIVVNESNTSDKKMFSDNAIVDCGILVNVPVNPNLKIQIGDSISAKGRMDIELA